MNTTKNVEELNEWQSPHDAKVIDKKKRTSLFDRAVNNIKDFASLSSLLRICGGIAVLVSMSMFLMQAWDGTGDFQRFCMMLSQTFLLGVGGLAMTKLLKEVKGARLFFGLALVSVTANFTTLGALIYSVFSLDGLDVLSHPSFASWKVDSASVALTSLGLGLAFLVPLSWLAFSVLARPAAKQLTLWYVGMNMLLLIPVREVTFIVILVAVTSIVLMKLSLQKKVGTTHLFTWNTKEGNYARLILFVPLIIMLARSILHYDFNATSELITVMYVYGLSVFIANALNNKVSIFGYLVAFFAGLYAAVLISFYMDILSIPVQLEGVLFTVLFGSMCAHLYRHGKNTWMQLFAKNAAAVLMPSCLVINHLTYMSLLTAFSALLVAAILLAIAFKVKDKALAGSALLIGALFPVLHFQTIINFFIGSGWLGFAVGGVSIIIFASLLDRYGAIVKLKLSS